MKKSVLHDDETTLSGGFFIKNPNLKFGIAVYRRNILRTLEAVYKTRLRKLELFLGSKTLSELISECMRDFTMTVYDVDLAPIGFSDFINVRKDRFGELGPIIVAIARFEELKFLAVHTTDILQRPAEPPTEPWLLTRSLNKTLRLRDEIASFSSPYDVERLDYLLTTFAQEEATDEINIQEIAVPTLILIGRKDWYHASVLRLHPTLAPLIELLVLGTHQDDLCKTAEKCKIPQEVAIDLAARLHSGGWLECAI